ncbi:unnamed protein product [Penicillium glandicola]
MLLKSHMYYFTKANYEPRRDQWWHLCLSPLPSRSLVRLQNFPDASAYVAQFAESSSIKATRALQKAGAQSTQGLEAEAGQRPETGR